VVLVDDARLVLLTVKPVASAVVGGVVSVVG
jgi:hypothetical protein